MEQEALRKRLFDGLVIPAHPLALDSSLKINERRQRTLSRYYLAAGAGGLAVGVHTTQFLIHSPSVNLYIPVLELAMEECRAFEDRRGKRIVKVAGLVGSTANAIDEASIAASLGYDCGLLSLGAMKGASEEDLLDHCRAVADVIPLFGFYLQPAVGGRVLPYSFWRQFAEIENVVAIKIAPFNRYATIDVIRAVAESGTLDRIALYTGNDDNIIGDLITPFSVMESGARKTARIKGGLLGHWAYWTRKSVETLARVKSGSVDSNDLLRLNAETTDANAAIFDASNGFKGCLPGIHEILRRNGLLEGTWCLDPEEVLSPGQAREISRVCELYPHLDDKDFVRENLDSWLAA